MAKSREFSPLKGKSKDAEKGDTKPHSPSCAQHLSTSQYIYSCMHLMTPLKGDEEATEGAVHGFPGMPVLSHHCPHLTLPPHSAASFSQTSPSLLSRATARAQAVSCPVCTAET